MGTTTWTAGYGRWFNAPNWSAGVPGAGDDAILQTGGWAVLTTVATDTIPADPPASTGTLVVNAGAALELQDFASLSVSGNMTNSGSVSLDAGPYSWAGASLSVGGVLTNQGRLQLFNGRHPPAGPVVTTVSATSFINDNTNGRIDVVGSTSMGYRSALLIGSAAGFGTAGTVTGAVLVSGDGLIRFASGQLTTIAAGATLGLTGARAFVANAADTNSNSALVGLTLNNGNFALGEAASVTTSGPLTNTGGLSLDAGPYGWAGSNLALGGVLTNTGRVQVANGGQNGTTDTWLSAPSIVNGTDARIDVVGSSTVGNQAQLLIGSAAGFGTAGTVTGTVTVSGDGLIRFASGQLTTIASGAALSLTGPRAFVAHTADTNSNSALVGLAQNNGNFALGEAASVTTSGPLTNTGGLSLDAGPYGWAGSNLALGGVLTNTGRVQVANGGQNGTTDTWLSAPSIVNGTDARIDVVGSSTLGNQAQLLIGSAAGFGTAGTLTGTVTVSGDGLVRFASGQLTTIAAGAALSLTGPRAFVANAADTNSNSALVGLTQVNGYLGIADRVAVNTSGPLTNTGTISLDGGPYGYAGSSLAIGGALSNTGRLELARSGSSVTVGSAATNDGIVNIGQTSSLTASGAYSQRSGSTLVNGSLSAATIEINEGTFQVGAGATLNGTIAFRPGSGLLVIDGPTAPTNAILGLEPGDRIRLSSFAYDPSHRALWSPNPGGLGGVLSIVNGSGATVTSLNLADARQSSEFVLRPFLGQLQIEVVNRFHDDFNADGKSDILLQRGANLAEWFMFNGAYSGGRTLTTALPAGWTVAGTGDFNRDGFSDVVLQGGGTVAVWRLDASGQQIGTTTLTTALPAGWAVVGTGDVNGDGVTDLVLQGGGTVVNWLLNSAGQYIGGNVLSTGLPPGWQVVGVGDLTRDGIADVVLQGGSTVVDWILNAGGGYQGGNVLSAAVPAGWTVRALGDFNEDRFTDLVFQGGNTVVNWLIANGGYAGGNVLATGLPGGWDVVGTGDFNGDGTSDITLQGGGTVVDWIISNGHYAGGNVITTGLPAGWSVVGKT